VSSLLRETLFLLAVVVFPGLGLQRALRVRTDPALVLPLGILFGTAAYGLALVLGWFWLFPLLVLLASGCLVVLPSPGGAPGPPLKGALAPIAVLVVVLAWTGYRTNRVGPGGGFVLDHTEAVDSAFHVGVAYELATAYPPQVPGLSGVPLHYHYGGDLLRGAAVRFAGVPAYDSLSRYELTLFPIALLLALRSLTATLAGPRAVLLVSWSVLATDFSFLLPLVDREAKWWAQTLDSNLLPGLLLANASVPALALAAGSLLALRRYEQGEGGAYLPLAAALALGVPFFKVFLGAQLLLGLCWALLLGGKRPALLALALPVGLAILALTWGQTGGGVLVMPDPVLHQGLRLGTGDLPLGIVQSALDDLNLAPAAGARLAVAALLWVVLGLGLRGLGLVEAVSALVAGTGARTALAAMALSGIPLGLLVRITLKAQHGYDEAGYFVELAGALLFVFAAMAAERLPPRGPGVLVLLGLLAFPASVEFVFRKGLPESEGVEAPVVHAMAALETASPRGAVVLERPHLPYPPPPMVFAGRRVAFTTYIPYLPQFAPESLVSERHAALKRFFETTDPQEAVAIARNLRATYLCLYPGDALNFDGTGVLGTLYTEKGMRVYRILMGPPPD
jgi:hypothetical protein